MCLDSSLEERMLEMKEHQVHLWDTKWAHSIMCRVKTAASGLGFMKKEEIEL